MAGLGSSGYREVGWHVCCSRTMMSLSHGAGVTIVGALTSSGCCRSTDRGDDAHDRDCLFQVQSHLPTLCVKARPFLPIEQLPIIEIKQPNATSPSLLFSLA